MDNILSEVIFEDEIYCINLHTRRKSKTEIDKKFYLWERVKDQSNELFSKKS
jgi:hypothetical protein